ncbi:hypothetical protein Glove_543g96 [Diversispora epigaea]|uniref:Uncharacterized protein n=1 Tax=Diversispora epigaea TaxID=1348612 RepID=A0A397GI66_9GLOM|nr:hypothetical protein Glove_543g96 [Diversispora epigaea]
MYLLIIFLLSFVPAIHSWLTLTLKFNILNTDYYPKVSVGDRYPYVYGDIVNYLIDNPSPPSPPPFNIYFELEDSQEIYIIIAKLNYDTASGNSSISYDDYQNCFHWVNGVTTSSHVKVEILNTNNTGNQLDGNLLPSVSFYLYFASKGYGMENDAVLQDTDVPKFIDDFLGVPENDPNSFETFLANGGLPNFPPNDITLTPMGKALIASVLNLYQYSEMRNKAINIALQDLSTSGIKMINDLTPIRIENRQKGFLTVGLFQVVVWTAFIFASVEFGPFVPYVLGSVTFRANAAAAAALINLAEQFKNEDEIEIDQLKLNQNIGILEDHLSEIRNASIETILASRDDIYYNGNIFLLDNFANPINQCGQGVKDCEENRLAAIFKPNLTETFASYIIDYYNGTVCSGSSTSFVHQVCCDSYKGCLCSRVVNSPIPGCQTNCVIAGGRANNGGGYSWNELQYVNNYIDPNRLSQTPHLKQIDCPSNDDYFNKQSCQDYHARACFGYLVLDGSNDCNEW